MKGTESDTQSTDNFESKTICKGYLRIGKSMQKRARQMAETDSINTNKQTEGLLEQILARDNLNGAYKQVKRNKGAGNALIQREI